MEILAVSASDRSAESIAAIIREGGMSCSTVTSASIVRQKILDQEWYAVVINYPLMDESGLELARMITAETSASAVMLMGEDAISMYGETLDREGILTVTKPLLKPVFFQTLRIAGSIRRRIEACEEYSRKLERRIDEMKIVGKAKCLLAAKHSMSEEEAHRTVERTAMDMRITLRDAALMIIRRESAR